MGPGPVPHQKQRRTLTKVAKRSSIKTVDQRSKIVIDDPKKLLSIDRRSEVVIDDLKKLSSINPIDRWSQKTVDDTVDREYLANGWSDFNGTKKIGINTKNYTYVDGQNIYPDNFTKSHILTKENKDEKGEKLNKGKKKHYNHGDTNRRQVAKSDDWMTRLRPRARPIFPGNSN